MGNLGQAALLGALATSSVVGCGGPAAMTAQAPSILPNLRVDAAASEVRAATTTDAKDLKIVATKAIQETMTLRSGPAKPTRYSLVVTGENSTDGGGIACVALTTPLALGLYSILWTTVCKARRDDATVELRLDVGDKHYLGKATVEQPVNFMGGSPGDNWSIVVHNAVQQAILNVKEIP